MHIPDVIWTEGEGGLMVHLRANLQTMMLGEEREHVGELGREQYEFRLWRPDDGIWRRQHTARSAKARREKLEEDIRKNGSITLFRESYEKELTSVDACDWEFVGRTSQWRLEAAYSEVMRRR